MKVSANQQTLATEDVCDSHMLEMLQNNPFSQSVDHLSSFCGYKDIWKAGDGLYEGCYRDIAVRPAIWTLVK